MTQEIIEMAKQVGVGATGNEYYPFFIEELVAFAKLVAAKERESWPTEMEAMERQVNILTDELAKAVKAEREACASMLEDLDKHAWNPWDCADAIRARGEA